VTDALNRGTKSVNKTFLAQAQAAFLQLTGAKRAQRPPKGNRGTAIAHECEWSKL